MTKKFTKNSVLEPKIKYPFSDIANTTQKELKQQGGGVLGQIQGIILMAVIVFLSASLIIQFNNQKLIKKDLEKLGQITISPVVFEQYLTNATTTKEIINSLQFLNKERMTLVKILQDNGVIASSTE